MDQLITANPHVDGPGPHEEAHPDARAGPSTQTDDIVVGADNRQSLCFRRKDLQKNSCDL